MASKHRFDRSLARFPRTRSKKACNVGQITSLYPSPEELARGPETARGLFQSRERKLDLAKYPERYEHVWEGVYARAFEGAYFAEMMPEARAQGRIGEVSADPLLRLRALIDIGGSGARADAFTIWIVQWIGNEMRILDHYAAVRQVLAFHVNRLRSTATRKPSCICRMTVSTPTTSPASAMTSI
ncbi:hypothetical protein [Bradyrhizobium sp. S69]|uniref:hypothetical protein n=1 Tax=Bradyrhizobium sp. S69 TaxID=1641856 RepID=UPI001FEDC3F3|nr:hypothetical protein [Bradyrhizobium sp. S69]